jgi:methylenetetrahydrofolate--tRNA-(uracil-5-)-methyltransferase
MTRPEAVPVTVVGAGLAGSEAAWQLAQRGVAVRLVEMRPQQSTPAHTSGDFAELVCSNSLKSLDAKTAAGALKRELAAMGSFVLQAALECRVPAGGALAVDRAAFAAAVTQSLRSHPNIEVVRQELRDLDALLGSGRLGIIATGPLTSPALAEVIGRLIGSDYLAFFDAAAPIIAADSLDTERLFAQSRYDRNGADYLNAALDRETYEAFIDELVAAERSILRDFESKELFQACQPLEEIARKGLDALRFGALKPVGLTDPKTGRRPWAAVQLRAETRDATAYNLVGFQTNLTFSAQQRVFRMIPGLERAEFARFGVMHRNTFIDSPRLLDHSLALEKRQADACVLDCEPIYLESRRRQAALPDAGVMPSAANAKSGNLGRKPGCNDLADASLNATRGIRFAGQITGTEGYAEAIGSGLFAGLATFAQLKGLDTPALPAETLLGSLLAYATDPTTRDYQPMHVNYGIMQPLPQRICGKQQRYEAYSLRAKQALESFMAARPDLGFLPAYPLPDC